MSVSKRAHRRVVSLNGRRVVAGRVGRRSCFGLFLSALHFVSMHD